MTVFNKISLLASAIVLLFFINLIAQDSGIEFSHITTEERLSYNNVTQILQDSRGFLWISTFNGLNRYDGYTDY